jgi:hypothetical protein
MWDFGISKMKLTEAGESEIENHGALSIENTEKYRLVHEEKKICVLDIPTFMSHINKKFIVLIDPIVIGGEQIQIFEDIRFIVNYYIKLLDTTELSDAECGKINKDISNLILSDSKLIEILKRYKV